MLSPGVVDNVSPTPLLVAALVIARRGFYLDSVIGANKIRRRAMSKVARKREHLRCCLESHRVFRLSAGLQLSTLSSDSRFEMSSEMDWNGEGPST